MQCTCKSRRINAYQLVGQKKDRLESELAVAKVEQILKTGAQQIENHGVVIAFGAVPTNEWDADTASERLVDASFILKLGMFGFDALKLDGNLLARDDVGAY